MSKRTVESSIAVDIEVSVEGPELRRVLKTCLAIVEPWPYEMNTLRVWGRPRKSSDYQLKTDNRAGWVYLEGLSYRSAVRRRIPSDEYVKFEAFISREEAELLCKRPELKRQGRFVWALSSESQKFPKLSQVIPQRSEQQRIVTFDTSLLRSILEGWNDGSITFEIGEPKEMGSDDEVSDAVVMTHGRRVLTDPPGVPYPPFAVVMPMIRPQQAGNDELEVGKKR